MYFVFFGSIKCVPCSILKEMIKHDEELNSINKKFLDIDVSTKNVFELYNIKRYPTIIFFNDLHTEIERVESPNFEKFKLLIKQLKII